MTFFKDRKSLVNMNECASIRYLNRWNHRKHAFQIISDPCQVTEECARQKLEVYIHIVNWLATWNPSSSKLHNLAQLSSDECKLTMLWQNGCHHRVFHFQVGQIVEERQVLLGSTKDSLKDLQWVTMADNKNCRAARNKTHKSASARQIQGWLNKSEWTMWPVASLCYNAI